MADEVPQAVRLRPHQFPSGPTGKSWTPKIRLSRQAYSWFCFLTEVAREEVNCFGTVDLDEDGVFVVDEVFVPKQTVSSMHASVANDALEALTAEWKVSRPNDWRTLDARLRMIFHSHGYGSNSESSEDRASMLNFGSPAVAPLGPNWFIGAIANKKGELKIHFYLYPVQMGLGGDGAIIFEDVPWETTGPVLYELREVVQAAYAEHVTEKPSVVCDWSGFPANYFAGVPWFFAGLVPDADLEQLIKESIAATTATSTASDQITADEGEKK